MKNRQLPLTIPTNLILAFTWEKGIKKMDATDRYGDGEETGEIKKHLRVNSARHLIKYVTDK